MYQFQFYRQEPKKIVWIVGNPKMPLITFIIELSAEAKADKTNSFRVNWQVYQSRILVFIHVKEISCGL